MTWLAETDDVVVGKRLSTACYVDDSIPAVIYLALKYHQNPQQGLIANTNLGGVDKSQVGILLVGHGQPDEWDREWPTETEQEISFRLEVLKHFEADGYCRENMSLAWMEFKEPKPAGKIEEFVQNGVEKVLYFPAAISADSIHSQFDIPELVEKARVPAGFPLINLHAWNDDPLVIQAIKEKIDACLHRNGWKIGIYEFAGPLFESRESMD